MTTGWTTTDSHDAFIRDYRVIFLSDATATTAYPDLGYGSMSAVEVHLAMSVILARDTADVIATESFIDRVATAPDVEKHMAADLVDGIARAPPMGSRTMGQPLANGARR